MNQYPQLETCVRSILLEGAVNYILAIKLAIYLYLLYI